MEDFYLKYKNNINVTLKEALNLKVLTNHTDVLVQALPACVFQNLNHSTICPFESECMKQAYGATQGQGNIHSAQGSQGSAPKSQGLAQVTQNIIGSKTAHESQHNKEIRTCGLEYSNSVEDKDSDKGNPKPSHFFSVITWVWPLRWTPAYSAADGEASTGSLVAGDLPRAVECVFQVRLAPSGVHCIGRKCLSQPVRSIAGDRSPATFPVTGISFSAKWTPEVILGQVCSFLIFWSCWLGFYLLAVTFSMRGGCKRFVAIESKSFDFTIVGTAKDVLKISKNGRGRRTSVFLPEHVALWLLRAWGRFYKSKSSNWCNQVRQDSSIFLLESKRNRAGKFLQLSVINKGKRTFVIFPAGWNERGWAMIFDALTEILSRPQQEH
ncbi:hypothetical protein Cgig2_015654 [Carnegiea gigantea]|uniref:Uncharacterized protein n=1 Tax=Carnegiea gigantea TaxID=171969 RepID=A0A9Q1Q935_9CARY|nr:hypothetical protein Cgig2_015654 [Carnegiea gigantea]